MPYRPGALDWPCGPTPRLSTRLGGLGDKVAVYDGGYAFWNLDISTQPMNNHPAGFYNVGFFDGSARGVGDPHWVKTMNTTYYAEEWNFGDWLAAQ